jgi:hypothetical protein
MMGARNYSLVAIVALLLGSIAWMVPAPAFAFFSAPLVECSQVTVPAALANCGSDPLTRGVASIDNEGNLDLVLIGAGSPALVYQVLFRSPDGTQSVTLTTITTGASGNASKEKNVAIALGKMGAGNIVLTRNGLNQYVTGIHVAASGAPQSGPDTHVELMSCKSVNEFPVALTNCGTDSFKNGFAEFESNSGAIDIEVTGAAANSSYAAVLRSPNGNTTALATITTNSKGNGQSPANTPPIAFSTFASGTVVLTRSSMDQALGGFRVTTKPKPRPASIAGLFRCIDVNDPAALDNCGTDPLTSGSAVLNVSGSLTVSVNGAAPSSTYTVVFRPIDSTGSSDTATLITLTTDTNGNAKGTDKTFATSGKVGSGNFVVQSDGLDQFVTGFQIK